MQKIFKRNDCRFLAVISTLSLSCIVATWSDSSLAYGQSLTSSRGSIQGNVFDPNGDNVDGATAILTPLPSGASISIVTKPGGFFSYTDLPAGHYRVSVKKAGFTPVSREVSLS